MDVASILTEKYPNTEKAGGSGSVGVSAGNVKPQVHAKRSTLSRHSSKDVSEDGCCLAKIFLSNIISFATRSRRKGVNERCRSTRRMSSSGGKNATTCIHAPNCKRKALSEVGVCDSFDDEMIRRLSNLPQGMDRNEWLATHTLSLFENVNALCGTISEMCTPVSCPIMSYPGVPKAHWVDERRKHHPYSAMQYIDCVLSFCEKSAKDERLYPTKYGSAFSNNFENHCRRLIRLLWHSCGHLYTNHWEQLATLNLRSQYGLVVAHMYSIAKMYDLLESKELSALSHTLQLVRPAVVYHGCGHQMAQLSDGSNGLQQFPSSKSGSWGGYPTNTALVCNPYSQTC
ncbi:Mob1/phocein family protein [Acanthocheilonema viteae]